MLKIGEFSKLSRISVRMLRHYDEIGLLHPVETDRFSGYRYYAERQLGDAARIRALRDIGFGLSDIGRILRCIDDETQTERYFTVRREELLAEARETAYRIQLLDTAEKWLRKENIQMDYNVSIKHFPQYKAACVRTVLPSYEEERVAWGILMEETAHMNIVPDEPCLCSVVFYDSEYKESDVDIEIRKSVKGDYPDTEHVKFRTVEPVTAATSIHRGSYRGLDAAIGATAQWVKDNGYEFDGNLFLIYYISPHETQDPDKFVTEICYPVRKA